MPQRLEVGDLSPTGNQRERAGQLTGVDIASEMIADASQALRRQSDFFRFHDHVTLLARLRSCGDGGGLSDPSQCTNPERERSVGLTVSLAEIYLPWR